MNIEEMITDLRARVNPQYYDQIGTESYERHQCVLALESLLARNDVLREENERLRNDAEFAAQQAATAPSVPIDTEAYEINRMNRLIAEDPKMCAPAAPAPIVPNNELIRELQFLEHWLQLACQPVGQECCDHLQGGECCGSPDPVFMDGDALTCAMGKRHREITALLQSDDHSEV